MSLAPGATIGRYQILEPLGQGGMATVYRAFQPALERVVALKVIRPGFAEDPEFLSRFQREAKAVAQLEHPNIVQVFDFDESDGRYFMAMQHLEGGTLKARLAALAAEGKRLAPQDVGRIVSEVAAGLAYAHAQGVLHRDVKPSNILFSRDGRAVVSDFGIAKIVGGTQLTQTGVGIGTPEYMSPEQGRGGEIDHRSDVYALGVVAYELLAGRVPFTADTPFAVVAAHMRDPVPPPSRLAPQVGPATERVLLKALAKDPADRYASTTDLAAALERAVAERAPVTLPTVPLRLHQQRTLVPRRRLLQLRALARPALSGGGTVLLVALLASGAAIVGMFGSALTGSPSVFPTDTREATTGSPTPAATPTGAPTPATTATRASTLTPSPATAASALVRTVAQSSRINAVGVNSVTGRVYYLTPSGVYVLDGASHERVAHVPIDVDLESGQDLAVNTVTNRIYTANGGANSVSVIDGASNRVVATVPLKHFAQYLDVHPTADRLYVADGLAGNVSAIDGATHTILRSVSIARMWSIRVNPVTNRLYVGHGPDGYVSILDGTSLAVLGTVRLDGHPLGLAIDPTRNRVYVTGGRANTVSVIDGASSAFVATHKLTHPTYDVVWHPSPNRLYVSYSSGARDPARPPRDVSVVDATTGTVLATIDVGGDPVGLSLNAANGRIYVVTQFDRLAVLEVTSP